MGWRKDGPFNAYQHSGSAINSLQTILPPPIFDAFTYPIKRMLTGGGNLNQNLASPFHVWSMTYSSRQNP